MKKGIYINDSIHGLISLSEYEKRIISSIGFNRLHDVYQNSTVYLTFPSNRTKRFEHSIGTMKLCSDMFYYSVLNTKLDILNKFYEIFENEIKNIVNYISADTSLCENKLGGVSPQTNEIPKIEFDKFRHSLVPNNVPSKYKTVHFILIQSIRAAALLHDIGHPPFSHIIENSMKYVYSTHKEDVLESNQLKKKFINDMSRYFEDNKKLHEQMGDEISKSILKEIVAQIREEDERYTENLFEIIILLCVESIFKEKDHFSYLHRIIDNSLDGDRLDYVTRDSINSGIDSGKIDYKRIINDMKICFQEEEILFCVPLKSVNSIEDFIKRRYNIYKDILYHHRVIKTDYLLEHTVSRLIEEYINKPVGDIINNRVSAISFDISGLWFPLGESTSLEKSNALSQWNDSWLMTVLRQIYYTEYYRNSINLGSPEYILSQQLSELLRNNKCYYSLIKRSENFKSIDDSAKDVFFEKKEEIEQYVKRINEVSEKISEKSKKDDKLKKMSHSITTIDMKATLDTIDDILSNTKKNLVVFCYRTFQNITKPYR